MKKRKKTINTVKIIIVLLMAAAIALSALAPVFGEEDKGEVTRERIQQRVSDFLEEAEKIASDFANIPDKVTRTVPVTGVPAGFSFQNDLRERATGPAVKHLQVVLNADPTTRVSSSGGGAPGRETNYFGPGTRSALIRFQRKHGISATGFFGSQTRAKMNEILRNGLVLSEEPREQMEEIRTRLMQAIREFQEIREEYKELKREENALEEDGEEEASEEDVD